TSTWPRRDRRCIALRPEQGLSISGPLPPFPRLACPLPRTLDRLLPATFAAAHRLAGCSARKFGAVRRRGAGRCNPRHGKTSTWPRRDRRCIACEDANPSKSLNSPAARLPGGDPAALFVGAEAGLARPPP